MLSLIFMCYIGRNKGSLFVRISFASCVFCFWVHITTHRLLGCNKPSFVKVVVKKINKSKFLSYQSPTPLSHTSFVSFLVGPLKNIFFCYLNIVSCDTNLKSEFESLLNNTANTQCVNCTSVITQVNMKILLFEVGTVIKLGGG